MPEKLFESKAYARLLQELNELFAQWENFQNARESVQDLRAFWSIGEKLERSPLGRAHRTELTRQLSRDLKRDYTQLTRFQQFFRQYEGGFETIPGRDTLSWSHYQETLAIVSRREREFYLKEALREGWPSRRLHRARLAKLYERSRQNPSRRHPHGVIARKPTHFFVYTARVEEIIDPDTLNVMADQGFHVWQGLVGRLRGLNAPELHGPERELALKGAEFVRAQLKDVKQIVVQSHKGEQEKYGRYLLDVFFHPVWEDWDRVYLEGFFLNQLLLDEGLARLAVY